MMSSFDLSQGYWVLEKQEKTTDRLPCPLIDDPDFIYFDSSHTDVTRTWRKLGWKPLGEVK